jgi:N-acetylglutamate synthase
MPGDRPGGDGARLMAGDSLAGDGARLVPGGSATPDGAGPASAMLELERAAAAHWRGTEEEWLGDWLLRAADGYTGRANSALPLGDPGLPLDAALDHVTGWYRARGLPPMLAVPLPLGYDPSDPAGPSDAIDPSGAAASVGSGAGLDAELTARGWPTRSGPAFVMVADLPLAAAEVATVPAGAVLAVDPDPDDGWLARYHYRGTDSQPPVLRTVLASAADQAFVSIRSGPDVLAVARLSIADGWAGLTAVEVASSHRRAGLGRAITAAACAEAVTRAARRVFLQVETGNAGARALYERCGFRYSHWYRYRMAPADRL